MNLSLDFYMLGFSIKGPSVPLESLPGNSAPLQKAGCLMLGGFHSVPWGGWPSGQSKGLEPE